MIQNRNQPGSAFSFALRLPCFCSVVRIGRSGRGDAPIRPTLQKTTNATRSGVRVVDQLRVQKRLFSLLNNQVAFVRGWRLMRGKCRCTVYVRC